MVSLRKMEEQDTGAVLQLEIKEEQTGYVSPIEQILARVEPSRDYYLLEMDGNIVGFFIIDNAYTQKHAFAKPEDIGLLAYFVDAKHQGKGVGKAGVKALYPYLQDQYPNALSVVLTVNCKNLPAIKSYLQGGFEDTEQLYHGGGSGPQHIMRMRLRD
jgi:predicted acetyltransferase